MSKKNTSVLRTFTDEPKDIHVTLYWQLISRRKTTAVEALGTSFSTSAERLLSEQSV